MHNRRTQVHGHIHTHIHACVHTDTHTTAGAPKCTDTHIHTSIQACVHTHIHTHTFPEDHLTSVMAERVKGTRDLSLKNSQVMVVHAFNPST